MVFCGILHCALWYIAFFFVVHCIVLCGGTLHCVVWYITLCFEVHCIVLCGRPTFHYALLYITLCLWYIALCFVVHCIVIWCGHIAVQTAARVIC